MLAHMNYEKAEQNDNCNWGSSLWKNLTAFYKSDF